MKIIFDHQIFGWQTYGGISRYACELAKGLAGESRQDVTVLSPLYVNNYLRNLSSDVNVFGVPIPSFSRSGRIYRAVNAVLAWPMMRFHRPDIVHETYYSSKGIEPSKSKVILTVYDMIHERFSDCFSKTDPTSREKMLAVRRADHVICISEHTRKDLIEIFNVDPNKTSVVHLGFTLTRVGVKQECLLPIELPSRPFLLYVGSRFAYKNFKGFLQAYANSDSLKSKYDVLCFGGGAFSDEEKKLFQQLNVSLNMLHQVTGDDTLLSQYYQNASAFVYPSLYEGFGIPPLEAMNFNCPVICSNVSSIPEVVGDAGEMFDPHDVVSIQQAIEKVMSGDELRQELIMRGQQRIKLFSWKRCAQETLDVYHKVLV